MNKGQGAIISLLLLAYLADYKSPTYIGLYRPGQKEPEPRNRTEITENRNRTNRTEGTVMKFGSGFLRTEINEIFSVLHSKEPKEPKNPKVLDSICYMCL